MVGNCLLEPGFQLIVHLEKIVTTFHFPILVSSICFLIKLDKVERNTHTTVGVPSGKSGHDNTIHLVPAGPAIERLVCKNDFFVVLFLRDHHIVLIRTVAVKKFTSCRSCPVKSSFSRVSSLLPTLLII